MTTRVFTEQELIEPMDDAKEVSTKPWRHGHIGVFVFEWGGDHWRVEIPVHHEEGWQLAGGQAVATKVHEVEKTLKTWVPVP
jgi:hypothetical protein